MHQLASIRTRDDLAALATGNAVELGVAGGGYSATILARSEAVLYSIDRWSDHHDDAEMDRAKRKLAVFGERSRFTRRSIHEARSTK